VDKPAGITSFEVVRRVKRLTRVRKAGHLGTLDPFATGLLPLALGEATKLAPHLMGESKTYRATLKLGEETDTQDLTGRVTGRWESLPESEAIAAAAARFVGEIEQVPPLYSALHHQGERLYRLARRGETVEVQPRRVVIHELTVEAVDLPRVTLRVRCSAGAYIRTLAQDLGRALGSGAHLAALRRLAVGPFRVDDAATLEQLAETGWESRLIAPARCLPAWPAQEVGLEDERRLRQGQPLPLTDSTLASGARVRLLAGGRLVALAVVKVGGGGTWVAPTRLFAAEMNE
jgi:tRNA pseudouridine55 synthase